MAKGHIQPGVAQIDNEIWLSLRELREELEREVNEVVVMGPSVAWVAKPEAWDYGLLQIEVGLSGGTSATVQVNGWREGALNAVGFIPGGTTFTNAGTTFTTYTADSTRRVESDLRSLSVNYSGDPKGIVLRLLPIRRK